MKNEQKRSFCRSHRQSQTAGRVIKGAIKEIDWLLSSLKPQIVGTNEPSTDLVINSKQSLLGITF